MFTQNPFAELSAVISPTVMQLYVAVMVLLVVGGTLFDVIHKKSAKYFFDNWHKTREQGDRQLDDRELRSIALKTITEDVLTSAEFCNPRRRAAHLFTMYGFVIYVIISAVMIFFYPTPETPTPVALMLLWIIGALMVCGGGYWFWFFIRVDVAAEGHSPFRIVRADLFILSLLGSATFGLIWALAQSEGISGWSMLFFGCYFVANTLLFGAVPWSKFAHMFFKPAAAFQKRVAEANGTRSNLPAPADKPERFGSARRLPENY